MKLQALSIILAVAVLRSTVAEGTYTYYTSSLGRDMYQREANQVSIYDELGRIEANIADVYARVLDNSAKIATLEKMLHTARA